MTVGIGAIVSGRSFLATKAKGDPVAHSGAGIWCWERVGDGHRLVGGPFDDIEQARVWMRRLAASNYVCGSRIEPLEAP